VAHSNFRYTQSYTFNRGKVDGTGIHAFTALCIYANFLYLISRKSLVLWCCDVFTRSSKHRWHIYGTVHLKVGKYRLLQ